MEFEPYPLRIEQTVNEILKAADLDIATELSIRREAEKLLGVDLSDLPSKRLVRRIVESFLLSSSPVDDEVREEKENVEEVQTEKFPVDDRNIASDDGGERVICRLSGKRRVLIENFKGTKMVSIREFYKKQGNVFTSGKGISLDPKEWSSFCSSFSDIDEAITKMESRMRDKCNGKKQTEAEPSNPSLRLTYEVDTCHPLIPIATAHIINTSGINIDEKFHVGAIISKLPPSWKHIKTKLMQQENFTLDKLIYRLKDEEDSRSQQKRETGSRKKDMKGLCFGCHQEGHIRRDCPLTRSSNRDQIND
ncbi:hypothetical protein E3N88_17003 [Mikania micrantha]|uniref:Uncharacterized protein n=1 Tax=Mikania micrantha TaxID=192012 RepID=A0A5N6NTL9_9ASTR|nr:hypothetical protein E3N88_17003 [Mikania micrantha]